MTTLEIVTRHMLGRTEQLSRNRLSLSELKGDWEQTLLIDDQSRGVAWANVQLAEFTPKGDYVWVLDDDDLSCYPDLVTDLDRLIARYHPDLVIVKVEHTLLGVLPSLLYWGHAPSEGHITCSNAIVRRDHWLRCRGAWGNRYEGDYDFLAEAYRRAGKIVWHAVVAASIPRISQGAV